MRTRKRRSIYPALREANEAVDADHLNEEHGYIKTFLYELGQMGAGHMAWLDKVREFRTLVAEHAKWRRSRSSRASSRR